MRLQDHGNPMVGEDTGMSVFPVVEDIIEERLEEIVTILSSDNEEKSRLHEEIMSMVEKVLIKIALRRSNHVKTATANFLGINRNTLNNKIHKLEIYDKKK